MTIDPDEARAALDRFRTQHDAVFSPDACPAWAKESIDRFVSDGVPTGDCLRAVLANDLRGAFGRADIHTARAMAAIVSYCHNRIRADAWGSYVIVDGWPARCQVIKLRTRYAALEKRAHAAGFDPFVSSGQPSGWHGEIPYIEFLIGKPHNIDLDLGDKTHVGHLDALERAVVRAETSR